MVQEGFQHLGITGREEARLKALDALRDFDRSKIDDGNTYSYALAWLLSLKP